MKAVTIRSFERRLTVTLEAVLAAGLLAMFLVLVSLVVMRYALHSGVVGANETATVVFVYLSSLGAAVAVGRQQHIRVDLLSQRVGPRAKLALDVTSLGLVAILNAVVLLSSLIWIGTTGHIPMPVTQVPRYVLQVSVPLGCGLAVLFCCTKLAVLLREENGR